MISAGSPTARGAVLPQAPLGEVLEFMRLLWAITHGLQKTSKRMHASLGITGPQRLVVRVVGRFPNISAGQLSDILHLDPSTLTGVLQRLERRRLIKRKSDPKDGRRIRLVLSAAGHKLDVVAAGTVEATVKDALRGLSLSKVAAARDVLAAIASGLEGSF